MQEKISLLIFYKESVDGIKSDPYQANPSEQKMSASFAHEIIIILKCHYHYYYLYRAFSSRIKIVYSTH